MVRVFGVVVGSCFTVFGVHLTNRASLKNLRVQLVYEDRCHRAEVRRERLEELYSLVSEWNKVMFSSFLEAKLVLEGHVDYNHYLDRLIQLEKPKGHLERLELIMHAYASEQVPILSEPYKFRDAMSGLMQEFKAGYLRGESSERFVSPYRELILAFNEQCDSLRVGIATELRNI